MKTHLVDQRRCLNVRFLFYFDSLKKVVLLMHEVSSS